MLAFNGRYDGYMPLEDLETDVYEYSNSSRNNRPREKLELRSRSGNGGGQQQGDSSSRDSSSGNNARSVLMERRLIEGDTLHKLALQYRVPAAELKRVNGLMSDQDFYALASVKIPVSKYSVLADSGDFLGPDALDAGPSHEDGHNDNRPRETVKKTGNLIVRELRLSNSLSIDPSGEENNSSGFSRSKDEVFKVIDAQLAEAKRAQAKLEQSEPEENFEQDEPPLFEHRRANTWHGSLGQYILAFVIISLIILVPLAFVVWFTSR